MARYTEIAWADGTWNPVRGCTKISPGCTNCYAKKLSSRNPSVLGSWGPGGVRVVGGADYWRRPVQYAHAHLRAVERGEVPAEPYRLFTASLADIFEDHPVVEGVRSRIWQETLPALDKLRLPDGRPALVLLALTKRAQIARDWYDAHGCPETVWPGITVEDQARADERIPIMVGLPRLWLSMEPLLGAVSLPDAHLGGLNWIIGGGESGPNARPMHPEWVRSLRDQCQAASVPFFFKQWGEIAPWVNERHFTHGGAERHPHFWIDRNTGKSGAVWIVDSDGGWSNWTGDPPMEGNKVAPSVAILGHHGKSAAGRILDGREWSEVPRG